MSEPENPDKPGSFTVFEPRWHDRVVLLPDYRIIQDNKVVIRHKDFPKPFYLNGDFARSFPLEYLTTKKGGKMAVRAVPLDQLQKEVIYPISNGED